MSFSTHAMLQSTYAMLHCMQRADADHLTVAGMIHIRTCDTLCTACAMKVTTMRTVTAEFILDMCHTHAGPNPLPNLYNVYHTSKQVTCNRYKTMKVSKSQRALAAKTGTTSHTSHYSVCG